MSPSPSRPAQRVLLIGWDAADWEHIDPLLTAGQMPSLQGLLNRGARGNLATLQPVISPMLWNSIGTGKTADKHGVLGFIEPHPNGHEARAWSSTSRNCKAVWNILHQQGLRCHVINWWASHPAEPLRGIVVSNAARHAPRDAGGACRFSPGTVHPPERLAEFAEFRMFPDEVTDALLLPFVPRAAEVDQEKDSSLAVLAGLLSECVTVQSLATEAMQREPWDFAAVYFEGIDHFCHRFMSFHPPRMEHISEQEFELYKDVVAGAYRFHDMMLERLLDLAGPDTTVILCSDHGFHSRRRPRLTPREPAGPIVWHRDFGIFAAAGPGIRQGARIFGASLLDITPTILTLLGLPCGKDMDGKPLTDALDDRASVPPRIASWEEVPGDAGRHPSGFIHETAATPADETTLRQFAALGYVDEDAVTTGKGADVARCEANYNLAQVHLACGRPDEALPLLEALCHQRPWETRYLNQWATACTNAGYFQQACEILSAAYPEGTEPPPPLARLVFARARAGVGDLSGALQQVALLAGATRTFPNLQSELGHILIDAGRLDLAERAFLSALERDPQCSGALQGLSSLHLRRHEYAAAADRALESLALIYQQPIAHFNLGAALARMGEMERAREALRRAVVMRPSLLEAWRWLAALESMHGPHGDFIAGACRDTARRISRERVGQAAARRGRANSLCPLPSIPPPAERRARAARERPSATTETNAKKTFTIVSGLPRSGTSVMMQMLSAAGLPALTDGKRAADEDNPEGYYEWEPIKRIASEPEILDTAGHDRRAIKCVSALLRHLPRQHRYRVIFMSRPAEEVARSQRRMIERRGTTGMSGSDEEIAASLKRHREDTLRYLHEHSAVFEVLLVNYPALIADPAAVADRVAAFLGPELLPNPNALAGAVQPDLYRNRRPEESFRA
jgi:predicted AlkP superfamily phosphohydrolase/phosphomutase/tetratricopeptide (TPR) repeat protein